MSLESFKNVINELENGVFAIFLWNWGEPFTNPHLCDMIRYARSKHIYVITSTNGTMINTETIKEINDSELNYLIIWMDAASQETYSRMRGGDFQHLVENVRTLINKSRRRLAIDLQFVVTRYNHHEVNAFKDLAHTLGPAKVSLKKLIPPESDLGPMLADVPPELQVDLNTARRTCLKPFSHLTLSADSTPAVCCFDTSTLIPNLNENRVMDSWNGPIMKATRRQTPDYLPFCSRCPNAVNDTLFIR